MIKWTEISSIKYLKDLDATKLADLIKSLVDHETKLGGPYLIKKSLKENVILNLHIYRLFSQEGKILENTYTYVESNRSLLPEHELEIYKTLSKSIQQKPDGYKSRDSYLKAYKKLSSILPKEIYDHVHPILNKISSMDKNGEISDLSEHFIQSYSKALNPKHRPYLKYFSFANICTWLAYTLYDDLIDEESLPLNVPSANILQRLAIFSYQEAGINATYIHNAFTEVDESNANEIVKCRFDITNEQIQINEMPDEELLRKLLFGRSSAHYIGPAFMLNNSADKQAIDILNKYCAARQLNDDIHDWEEDFSNGRITYVVYKLLKAAGVSSGSYLLSDVYPKLKKIFWEQELTELTQECLGMAQEARKGYVNILKLKEDSSFDHSTIKPIIDSCQAALDNFEYNKKFISAMNV